MSAVDPGAAATAIQWMFFAYFISVNSGYLFLNLLSLASIRRYLEARALDALPQSASRHEPPVSIIVQAGNRQAGIVASVRSLLQLDYPQFEVIVVNDGSTDETLAVLRQEFSLGLFPEAYWKRLPVARVRGIYRSTAFPNLRVIDKGKGGRADTLNAGINAARYPLVCVTGPDCILKKDSLRRMVQPLLEDPDSVVAGSTIRIANGCATSDRFLTAVGLPGTLLALMQIVEYLRALQFARLGWAAIDAALTVSGAFDVYRKEVLVEAGGFRSGTRDEHMELVARLHRTRRLAGKPCRIAAVPDPVCWTMVPESPGTLRQQRIRWQRGLAESLYINRRLLFHRHGGAPGWASFPFLLVFELFGPLIEVLGYTLLLAAFAFGLISWQTFAALMAVAIGFGILLSVSALLLEEVSFRLYRRPSQMLTLLAVAVIENVGYRQLVALWRSEGLIRWLADSKGRRHRAAAGEPDGSRRSGQEKPR
jgi:cellulose synthase/poly-beta-1,6-N-acetylglucosamine synthase-like glycosyltransferase